MTKRVAHRNQTENVPQKVSRKPHGLSDGTETDHYIEPDGDMSSEQANTTPTKRRIIK